VGSALQKTKTVYLSPFRYPGGKSWLAPEFRKWRVLEAALKNRRYYIRIRN